jgi:CheY-like chemotaxis protein
MTEPSPSTTILFVDPSPASVDGLRAEAATLSEPMSVSAVGGVPDAVHAFERSSALDAVVVNLDVGADAATELVAEIETRYPGLPVVAYADRLDDDRVATACHLGAAGLLARPFDAKQLQQLLAQPAPDAGFSGTTTGVPTPMLLTLHCAAGAHGALHLRCEATTNRPERVGTIYLDAGQPIHATAGELSGSQAVHAMLGWLDAEATWLPGKTRCARTIVGRWEGLLARGFTAGPGVSAEPVEDVVAVAYPEVVEKLSRLAQTPDVLGAFLLRHAEVVTGRCMPEVDETLAARALCRLAHVFFDVDAQPSEDAGREIQAVVGTVRLVIDRIGPPEVGFQVGVLVRQAAPVCKSLRRLLRQIDGTFQRAAKKRRAAEAAAGGAVNLPHDTLGVA